MYNVPTSSLVQSWEQQSNFHRTTELLTSSLPQSYRPQGSVERKPETLEAVSLLPLINAGRSMATMNLLIHLGIRKWVTYSQGKGKMKELTIIYPGSTIVTSNPWFWLFPGILHGPLSPLPNLIFKIAVLNRYCAILITHETFKQTSEEILLMTTQLVNWKLGTQTTPISCKDVNGEIIPHIWQGKDANIVRCSGLCVVLFNASMPRPLGWEGLFCNPQNDYSHPKNVMSITASWPGKKRYVPSTPVVPGHLCSMKST